MYLLRTAIQKPFDLSSLTKKPSCYQSHTPSCIDLIMTNRKYLFQLSNTFLTCLSNHHKFICTILKSGRFKGARIEKIYRSYKTFDVDQFQEILKIKLENIKNVMVTLKLSFLKELNKYALLKRKFLRHNSNLFLTKNLRKQIMVRSKPRNNYNKNRNYENWWKYNANAIFV